MILFAFLSFSLIFLTSINFTNLYKVLIKAKVDFKRADPFRAGAFFENALKIVNGALWKFLTAHSYTKLRVNIFALRTMLQLQRPYRIFVLHCHLSLRLPTFNMVSLCQPRKCALSFRWERKPPRRLNTNTRRTKPSHLSTGRDAAVCVEIPSHRCRAGWRAEMTHGVIGTHKYNSFWGPTCCSVLLVSRLGRAPLKDKLAVAGAQVVLFYEQRPVVGYSSQ